MKFGRISVEDAPGTVLGHSISVPGCSIKKGTLLADSHMAALRGAGVERVFAARLGADDVGENAAAGQIAKVLAGAHVAITPAATGRCNLFARADGVVSVDAARIDRMNLVHESLSVATLLPFERVGQGQLLATVKIIPYAVDKKNLDAVLGVLANGPAVALRPFKNLRICLVISQLPHSKASLLAKSESAMRARVESMGGRLENVHIIAHGTAQVAACLRQVVGASDLVLVFGASAIVDRGDVIPGAVVQAGGVIEHLGMPVDPGNLLLLARIGAVPVIGVPSCARSVKQNGFDRVLARLMAGLEVTGRDLMAMGVGGLLKEITSRPSPRET